MIEVAHGTFRIVRNKINILGGMNNVISKSIFLASAVLGAALLMSPAGVNAATQPCACSGERASTPDVAKELADFKTKAFQVRREAGILKSFTSYSHLHWKSHTDRLSTLGDHVNDMGRMLARLEEMKAIATESQQLAIDNARPHLVAIADQLGRAIGLVNENTSSVKLSPYSDTVTDISQHTTSLYEKLDTILNYESAKGRLNGLEILPESGS
jgi:hypothetical protein